MVHKAPACFDLINVRWWGKCLSYSFCWRSVDTLEVRIMPLGFYIILICCILFSFISFINLFLSRILDLACTFFAGIVDYRCSLIYQSLAHPSTQVTLQRIAVFPGDRLAVRTWNTNRHALTRKLSLFYQSRRALWFSNHLQIYPILNRFGYIFYGMIIGLEIGNTISLGTDIRVSLDGTIQDVSNIIY